MLKSVTITQILRISLLVIHLRDLPTLLTLLSRKNPKKNHVKGTSKTHLLSEKLSQIKKDTYESESLPFETISENTWKNCFNKCQKETSFGKFINDLSCCAICGMGFPNLAFPGIHVLTMEKNNIPNLNLIMNTDNTLILHPCGVIGDYINICSQDLECLSQSSIWKFSLANNNFEGFNNKHQALFQTISQN